MNFGGRARVNAAGGEPKITCGFYKARSAPIISLFATAPTAAVRRTNHDATRLFRVGVSMSLVAARFVESNLSPSLRIGNLKARKTAAELQPSTKGHAIFRSLSA
jgi:hypothetical protein